MRRQRKSVCQALLSPVSLRLFSPLKLNASRVARRVRGRCPTPLSAVSPSARTVVQPHPHPHQLRVLIVYGDLEAADMLRGLLAARHDLDNNAQRLVRPRTS